MDLLAGGVFLAGILSFFTPCTIPMIPVYIGVLAAGGVDARTVRLGHLAFSPHALYRTLAFIAGLSVVFVSLGLGAGFFGARVQYPWVLRVLGLVVIGLGLHQMGVLRLKLLEQTKSVRFQGASRTDLLGAFFLGLSFSFGWTPCISPVLGAIIGLSVFQGQTLIGGFYMLLYSVGMMIPFLFITLFSSLAMERLTLLERHAEKFKVIGGALITVMGLLLLSGQMARISQWFV